MLHTGFDAQEDGHEVECIRYTQERVFGLLDKLGVPVRKIGATMIAWTDQQVKCFFFSNPCSLKRMFSVSAESIDPCQPAKSTLADMRRYSFAFPRFFSCQSTSLPHDSVCY